MIYTGIGSRETPIEILEIFKNIGKYLGEIGYTLRSGGTDGADNYYEIFFINYYHAEYNKKDKYEIYKIRDSKIMNLLSNNKFKWMDFGYWEQLKILANQKENQRYILPYNDYKELQKQKRETINDRF